jgi:predicted nucleic-acid-binding protein
METTRLSEKGQIVIPKTVILETEWVLRYAYGISSNIIIEAFQRLFGLPNIHLEDSRSLFQAISWYENGLDFADALHLSSSIKAHHFSTFDKAFVKRASKLTSMEIFTP